MNINDYYKSIKNRFAPVADDAIIDKRYEPIMSLVQGNSLAVTPNCWLNHAVIDGKTQYDTVIASDEYLTYAASEKEQTDNIMSLCRQAKMRLIVTVRDFKNDLNRSENERNFHLHHEDTHWTTVEQTSWDKIDRQSWVHQTYIIEHKDNCEPTVSFHGPVHRRALYFKQLAKFSFDAGATSYNVVTQSTYRPLFKKHVEHIVIVNF